MERFIAKNLQQWSISRRRKPLLLTGARQVGKTWSLKELGRTSYTNCVHIDFERHPEYRQFFTLTKEPLRIIENLSIATGSPINPENTLIIFDEIQECPEALESLKYFCEDASEYHVACAGSLLGIHLAEDISYPVGKVNVMNMYPMTFAEFLLACDDRGLANYLASASGIEPIPDAFFNRLIERLRLYFVTGGLPEVVLNWTESQNIDEVQNTLEELALLYQLDLHKHARAVDAPKIDLVWQSLPSQLARENKKFLYSAVRQGARAREYENAVQWLANADMVNKVVRIERPGLPLSAYEEISAFKLYLLDVGLLRKQSGLDPSAFAEGDRLFREFKGAFAENFIAQELAVQFGRSAHYWAMDNPRYEVDFILQHENAIIPVEVKSGENVRARSLRKYREKYSKETPIAVRFSLRNISFEDGLLNIPLFMAGETKRILDSIPCLPGIK